MNWVRIAESLHSRTAKQCRERYHQNLKDTLNHDPISPEEGELIERLVAEMGKKWAEIARRLHGRSDNAVKNWWNGNQNRRKRQGRRKADYDERNGGQHYFPPNAPPPAHRPLPAPLLPGSLHHNGYFPVETPLTSPHAYHPSRFPPGQRPLPGPLPAGSLHHEMHYSVETPLTPRSTLSSYSESAPWSTMSDSDSHFSISPQTHHARPAGSRLPSVQTEGCYFTPGPSLSPRENNPPARGSMLRNSLPHHIGIPSPEALKAEPSHSHHNFPQHMDSHEPRYPSKNPQMREELPPTAPSTPRENVSPAASRSQVDIKNEMSITHMID